MLQNRKSQFHIDVSNSSQEESECFYQHDVVMTDLISSQCARPLTGRYVHIYREPGSFEARVLTLCEVVVMGQNV